MIDFSNSWGRNLPLIEFVYNNCCQTSIQIAPLEAFYGRECKSLVRWFEVGEAKLLGLDLMQESIDKVKLIKERLVVA